MDFNDNLFGTENDETKETSQSAEEKNKPGEDYFSFSSTSSENNFSEENQVANLQETEPIETAFATTQELTEEPRKDITEQYEANAEPIKANAEPNETSQSEYKTGFDSGFYTNSQATNQMGGNQGYNPYINPYQSAGQQGYQPNNFGSGYNSANSFNPVTQTNGSKKGKKVLSVVLAIVVLIAAVGIGTFIGKNSNGASNSIKTSESQKVTSGDKASLEIKNSSNLEGVDSVSPGIAVANKARSSVVGVVVYDKAGELAGEGSGVVMGLSESKDKTFVITCAHVVSDSSVKTVGILLEDGTVYDAEIVGYDERTDIGVISTEKTNLSVAEFGDSSALQVGETVYAIGNPGGSDYYGSVTNGIVSALDRSITSTYTMNVIQHTAPISPGNSGGALVNSNGQVIGINSSKIAATDYEGIGFAVPIAVAKPIVESLIEYGYVPNRPKLGISYASVTQYQAYSMVVSIKGLPAGSVIIASISDNSSFNGTDVQVGDMITAINGKDLTKSDILLDEIENSKVGDSIKLSIARINSRTYAVSTFDVTVKLVEDKGSMAEETTEETTENFYDSQYGNQYGGSVEDFWDEFYRSFGGF